MKINEREIGSVKEKTAENCFQNITLVPKGCRIQLGNFLPVLSIAQIPHLSLERYLLQPTLICCIFGAL